MLVGGVRRKPDPPVSNRAALRARCTGRGDRALNACAVLTILVGTPLAGFAFELGSDGHLAFVIIAVLGAAALLPLRAVRL